MIFVYRTSAVGPSGIPLSDYAEGDIIKLNESGSPVEFYVAKHDYESGLNGAGRTLVVRKDCYDNRVWDNGNVNAWANCTIRSWLNEEYKSLLDQPVQESMGSTTYYYTPGNGTVSVETRSDSVFLLSITELGIPSSYVNTEGSILPIASALQIAYEDGIATSQWSRTPYKSNNISVSLLSKSGLYVYTKAINSDGARPVFTLPSTLIFNSRTNEVIA